MSDLKKKAAELATYGRHGDTMLLHVAPEELRGLASLMPDGKLTTNPDTGLPEAFFFLPFLAGLGAAAAPAAAAAVPAATTVGAGMAAGAGAAATGLAGLGAAAAPAATGSLFGSTLAATAPTAASGLAATGSAAAGAGGAGLTAALPTATGAAATGAGAGATGAASLGTAGQAGAALAGPASFANPAGATAAGLAGAFPAAPAAAATGTSSGGLAGLFGGMDASKMLQYGALASMMLPQMGGGGGSKEGKSKKLSGQNYDRGEQAEAPDDGAQGGVTEEFDYFPRARYYAGGGLIRGYAEGGLASIASSESAGDEQLIDQTVAALTGQSPNPEAVIQQFIQVFGPQALQDLIKQVQGGGSDGMSDSVPATVSGAGGSEPAALSEGEFVVPADVVSGLGNGSTEAGARQLEGMMDRTRQMRGGGMVQPPAINPRAMMPM